MSLPKPTPAQCEALARYAERHGQEPLALAFHLQAKYLAWPGYDAREARRIAISVAFATPDTQRQAI